MNISSASSASFPLIDVFAAWSGKRVPKSIVEIGLVLTGAAFIGLLAQVAVPLPFTFVPISGQTLGVLMIGALYGSKRGAVTLLTYLAEGVVGFPVFAEGRAGLAVLMGPTGGYLAGFVVAAYVTGLLAEKGMDRKLKTALPAFFLGHTIIFAFGLAWLAQFVGRDQLLAAGLYPFIPGEIVKTVIAALALPSAWAAFKAKGWDAPRL